jgi:hypothetical protein
MHTKTQAFTKWILKKMGMEQAMEWAIPSPRIMTSWANQDTMAC